MQYDQIVLANLFGTPLKITTKRINFKVSNSLNGVIGLKLQAGIKEHEQGTHL